MEISDFSLGTLRALFDSALGLTLASSQELTARDLNG
jgi:hypothetical protein